MAKRILVVDDEENVVRMVKSRLESGGYEVITASDGEEGLIKARANKPDLAILDILMPKLDGGKMAETMKLNDDLKNIPIIFLTCLVEGKEVQNRHMIGGNLFLAKPFDGKELLAMVGKVLGK
jgi:DNA-binding response OmpR family regulator